MSESLSAIFVPKNTPTIENAMRVKVRSFDLSIKNRWANLPTRELSFKESPGLRKRLMLPQDTRER